jgi:hypothetical protein
MAAGLASGLRRVRHMNKVLLACVLSPGLASAEYYSAASTGGFQHRSGSLLVGAYAGLDYHLAAGSIGIGVRWE